MKESGLGEGLRLLTGVQRLLYINEADGSIGGILSKSKEEKRYEAAERAWGRMENHEVAIAVFRRYQQLCTEAAALRERNNKKYAGTRHLKSGWNLCRRCLDKKEASDAADRVRAYYDQHKNTINTVKLAAEEGIIAYLA